MQSVHTFRKCRILLTATALATVALLAGPVVHALTDLPTLTSAYAKGGKKDKEKAKNEMAEKECSKDDLACNDMNLNRASEKKAKKEKKVK